MLYLRVAKCPSFARNTVRFLFVFCSSCFLVSKVFPGLHLFNRAFSPLVIVGMASSILVAIVTLFYIMKE